MELRCPTCDSPEPRLHPAVQAEGEVSHICPDAWHRLAAMVIPTVIPLDGNERTYRSGESFTIEYTTTISNED